MKKIILILTLLTLTFNAVRAQTVFGFETATDTGATITETIDGITVTLSGDPDLELLPGNDFGGTSGNVALTQNTITSVTFTFDQPVVVNSIIPIEAYGSTVDYTFTPTGGSNEPVTVSLIQGATLPVNLNWVNVTSFTVTASGAAFGFDDLSVDTGTNGQTFFEWETANNSGGTISETVNGIGVTVSGDSSYSLADYGGASGTSGNVIVSNANRTSITFTFDQPVVVNSILALEGTGANIDYTFTPTGGDNSAVTKSLVSGATTVTLNWSSVTSFTVTSSGSAFGFDNLSVTGIGSPILFDFETAMYHLYEEGPCTGDSYWTDQTIDGITVTVISSGDEIGNNCISVIPRVGYDGLGGITGYAAVRSANTITTVTFTFSESVVVNSLLPYDWISDQVDSKDIDFTFTPIGGNNSPVTVTLIKGISPSIKLNWIGVTSFTITTTEAGRVIIDNLSVTPLVSLGVTDEYNYQKAIVFPNPVENTLYIKNVSNLKSISLYNLLGQQVLEGESEVINVSGLSKGLYLLQLITDQGMETKRIVKK